MVNDAHNSVYIVVLIPWSYFHFSFLPIKKILHFCFDLILIWSLVAKILKADVLGWYFGYWFLFFLQTKTHVFLWWTTVHTLRLMWKFIRGHFLILSQFYLFSIYVFCSEFCANSYGFECTLHSTHFGKWVILLLLSQFFRVSLRLKDNNLELL